MRLKGRQLRFVAGTLGGWMAARAAIVWLAGGATVVGGMETRWPARLAPAPVAPPIARLGPATSPAPAPAPVHVVRADTLAPHAVSPPPGARATWLDPLPPLPSQQVALVQPPATAGEAALRMGEAEPAATPSGHWKGEAYLFVRPGGGTPSLAAGGQLGGSQAAARLAYQLNRDGPVRTAVAARLYAPLESKGAEAALGLDWHPFAGVPVRVSVERRFGLDGQGRNAWSAYAAGGFYLEQLHGRVALDGYAQGGVVGTARRDLFVDGALRAGRRWQRGRTVLTAGAGLWGAAQPGVARLDVGPRLGLALPVERHTVSVAAEGRLRVAGAAHPGSGAALTLAVGL